MSLIRHRQETAENAPSLLPFDWALSGPAWWPRLDDWFRDAEGRQLLRVEEFDQDGTLVVRAEMPGIDPDKDVEISVSDGALHIHAERTEETQSEGRHFHRKEIRYGGFSRSVSLPEGVSEDDIAASYKNGILEIRVPLPEKAKTEAKRVPVTRA